MKRKIAKGAREKRGVAQAVVGPVTVYQEEQKAANVFRLSTWVQKGNRTRTRVTGSLSIPLGSVWPGDWVNEAYRAHIAADGRNGQKLDFNWANLQHWRARIGRRGLPLPTPRMDAVALAEWKAFNKRLKEHQGDAIFRVRFSKKDWMKLDKTDRLLDPSVLLLKKQALCNKGQFYILGVLTSKEISDKLSYYQTQTRVKLQQQEAELMQQHEILRQNCDNAPHNLLLGNDGDEQLQGLQFNRIQKQGLSTFFIVKKMIKRTGLQN